MAVNLILLAGFLVVYLLFRDRRTDAQREADLKAHPYVPRRTPRERPWVKGWW